MGLCILVEGRDDASLITNVARAHGVRLNPVDDIEIKQCGGIETLLGDSLDAALKGTYEVLAVVVDSDSDVANRWRAISKRLAIAGYSVPTTPSTDGLILADGHPVVGLWLMPDNALPGILEDFAAQLIPDDELWRRAKESVARIPQEHRRFKPTAIRKAEIHTWLAWQEDPGTPLGLAVTKRYFQTDTELCRRFANWLRRLIELSEASS